MIVLRQWRWFILLVACLSMIVFLMPACSGDDDDDDDNNDDFEQPPEGNKVGDTALDFTLNDRNEVAHMLSQYRGNVILLDVTAMWCPPCQQEASKAEALYQEYREQGFIIITVLIEDSQRNDADAEDCGTWADRYDLTFPVLYDVNNTVWNLYNEEGYIPLNLVIDKNFVIRYKQTGYNEAEIVSVIQEYL